MMVPKSLPIMGIPFSVDLKKKLPKGDHGGCDGPNRKITLAENEKPEVVLSTLMHEIIHGIIYVSGQSEWMTDAQEEGLVVALESGLMQLYELKHAYTSE